MYGKAIFCAPNISLPASLYCHAFVSSSLCRPIGLPEELAEIFIPNSGRDAPLQEAKVYHAVYEYISEQLKPHFQLFAGVSRDVSHARGSSYCGPWYKLPLTTRPVLVCTVDRNSLGRDRPTDRHTDAQTGRERQKRERHTHKAESYLGGH